MLEKLFEHTLWKSRFFVLFAVIFSLLGSIVLFLVASVDLFDVSIYTITNLFHHPHPDGFHEHIVSAIIGSIDLYLMAVVMLIFSFGLYELFISDIDPAKEAETDSSSILEIHSLDQLKDKLAKVILMVLIVSFFKQVVHTEYNGALEMLYFSLSILALAVGLYFMHKGSDHH
jgi:uncharacterized membrane protein YqhA